MHKAHQQEIRRSRGGGARGGKGGGMCVQDEEKRIAQLTATSLAFTGLCRQLAFS